jgi:hypothetical protein
MKIRRLLALIAAFTVTAHAEPPYSGTVFVDPDIVTSADRSNYLKVKYTGREKRSMFDRRKDAFISLKPHLFRATFKDSRPIEVQVNPEFGNERQARKVAIKYAREIGRLPRSLRTDVKTVWIHKGNQLFGGGNNNILIHTGQSAAYERDGFLEEVLVHEACHTSLDARHAASTGWLAAQQSDPEFISTYARDNPTREDIAESFLLWMAVRYRSERITPELANIIETTMPARISYFDAQGFAIGPVN